MHSYLGALFKREKAHQKVNVYKNIYVAYQIEGTCIKIFSDKSF